MKSEITTEVLPIKLWLDEIEDGAMRQARNLANLPFVFKHVAIMPDSHEGYGMPIGGIIATKGVVVPNAVGVDIGCGMCAVRTSLDNIYTDVIKKILSEIREEIPLGMNRHDNRQDFKLMPHSGEIDLSEGIDKEKYPVICHGWGSALKSLGSLGGGNHFIEIQHGSDGKIWIMLHSGSRNLGLKVAEHYNNKAKKLNAKWFSSVPVKWDLAYLPIDEEEGKFYMREMRYCVEYAYANRKLMMDRIKNILLDTIPGSEQIEFDEMINIAHNYADFETHYDTKVIVHRKGATRADEGLLGIIPGSQGTKSYIVKGKGNPESFRSCSHGAGRIMSRTKAINTIDLEKEKAMLDSLGILHAIRTKKDLDEAPSAYKNIDVVMENQKDLVDILIELHPLAVIKG
jgi:tRNA-splicing ligase RtcB